LACSKDLLDRHVGQIEDRAQHLAFVTLLLAFAGVQVDGAAQLLLALVRAEAGIVVQAEQPQRAADDRLHGPGHGPEHDDDGPHHRRHGQGQAVGIVDRVGLWQDLGENQHQDRHDDGGVSDPGLAEPADQQARGERRGHDVDQVVAQQDDADQAFLGGEETVHQLGTVVALLFQRVHPRPGGCGQRCLRAGEKGREQQQHQDGADRDEYLRFHLRILVRLL
jgi:hypothetical protein